MVQVDSANKMNCKSGDVYTVAPRTWSMVYSTVLLELDYMQFLPITSKMLLASITALDGTGLNTEAVAAMTTNPTM